VRAGAGEPGGAPPAPVGDDLEAHLSLRGTRTGFIDRWLPRRPIPFVAVALAIPLAAWTLGLILAPDKGRFLGSRIWLAQPPWFAVHLVVMRLFTTAYSRHFLDGVARLTAGAGEARRRMERLLGPAGVLVAIALAAPLAWADLRHVTGPDFLASSDAQGSVGHVAPSDAVLGALWCVEWVLTSYVWVLLIGFAALTIRTIERHDFAAPLEVVLHERHYRPFLLMSAQGASILLGYTVVTGIYVLAVRGGLAEWIGLWITAGLLLLTFVPPWMRLKRRIAQRMREEAHRLGTIVLEARQRWAQVDDRRAPVTTEEVGARLDVVLAILESEHLERLYRDLGRSEGQSILLRLLAPLATVLARLLRG
jgi:hypothetical protein